MSQQIYSRRPVNNSAIPDVIFVLLIANGLVFALQQFAPVLMERLFALQPLADPPGYSFPSFMPWQLLTYGFLHDTRSLMHILFNMLMLWMFGRDLERGCHTRNDVIRFFAGKRTTTLQMLPQILAVD